MGVCCHRGQAVCPVQNCSTGDLRQECYLSYRCVDACKLKGLSYGRSGRGLKDAGPRVQQNRPPAPP
jgi:hypothetical protein